MSTLSPRLAAVVDALPLHDGIRVLEIGCGPGAAAREVSRRVGSGFVLAVDRSATAIAQATRASAVELASGRLAFRCTSVEHLVLDEDEAPYDLAFAVRVGALDGRHPTAGAAALARLATVLTASGTLLVDGGDPLRELPVSSVRPSAASPRRGTTAPGSARG